MTWSVQLVETKTGNVLQDLDVLQGGSGVDGPLNSGGSTSTLIAYAHALQLPRWALVPYAAAVVPCWDDTPLTWSPLVAPPRQQAAQGPVSLVGGSMWDLLQYRLATDLDHGTGKGHAMQLGSLHLTGSLGGIAWQILQRIQWRQSGVLPIRHGSPLEPGAGHERTYPSFDAANIDAAGILQGLAAGMADEVRRIPGPDMRFRPERLADRRIGIVFEHGTTAQPEIAQTQQWTLDLTVPRPNLADPRMTTSWQPLSRLVGTGAGQDAGALLSPIDADRIGADGHLPWLEDIWSASSITDWPLLDLATRAQLQARQLATAQIGVEIPADSVEVPLDRVRIGDRVRVRWPDGWLELPRGEYEMTILQISWSYGSTYSVEFQAMGVTR